MSDLKLLFLEPYLIGSLCGETILFLLYILDFLDFCNVRFCSPLYTPGVLGCLSLFDINESLLLIKKKI